MRFSLANNGISIFIFLSVSFIVLISAYARNPRLTYDSKAYIEASENIDTYFHGKNTDGHTYLFRPPIIPIYLHFFEDKILAAKELNAICFVLSLWLCYLIGREFKFEVTFLSLFVISVGISYPWLQNHFFVWSEPLFSTLLLLVLWMVVSKRHWVWIGLLCLLLYFVRKAGLIIMGGIIGGYLFQRDYKRALLIGIIVGVVALWWEWLTWSYSSGTTILTMSADSPTESKRQYLDVITAWFLPRHFSILLRILILCLSAILISVNFKEIPLELIRNPEIKMVFVIGAIYTLTFVLLWRLDYNEVERYLSVLVPLAMLLVIALLRRLSSKRETKKYWLLFFLLWMTYPVGRTLYHFLL